MEEYKKDRLTGYNLVNLEELVSQVGEERSKEILSDFCCPMNGDVEYFLRHKAIEFSKQRLAQTQLILGGKFVYLECEDKPQLLRFYRDNGFVDFGHRDLEKDERDRQSGNYLVQLLKYMD